MKTERPVPQIIPSNAEQFDYARQGILALQYCTHGHGCWFPPSTNCPTCLSTDIEWRPVSGRGTLWSWVRMHQPYFAAFADELPYLVAMIKLDEGPMMVSSVVDADLIIDSPVEVVFEAFGPESTPMPLFRRVSP